MKSCAISITRRRLKLSAIAPEASEKTMIGSVVEACTSATMFAEVVIVVIIQAAPTAWISPPKFEREAREPDRPEVGFRSGARAEARGLAAASRAICGLVDDLSASPPMLTWRTEWRVAACAAAGPWQGGSLSARGDDHRPVPTPEERALARSC